MISRRLVLQIESGCILSPWSLQADHFPSEGLGVCRHVYTGIQISVTIGALVSCDGSGSRVAGMPMVSLGANEK